MGIAMTQAKREELLTVPEFSAALKIKECTTRKWLLLRKIRAVKVGNSLIRIPASELARLLTDIPARPEVR
jgi:excisionase family DNA binding protein